VNGVGSEISGGEACDLKTVKDGLKLKGLAEMAYWDLIRQLPLAAVATNVIGKWCIQKILVLVFQMGESKQNTWMG
jgi:hypothetical protein